jgi:hypothetical protein
MTQNRGCFDRHDNEFEAHEYASPPCYMHEVDPSYFGLFPSTRPKSDRKPNDPKLIVDALPKVGAPRDASLAWPKVRRAIRRLSRSIGRHVATQIERVEARRELQAVARLLSRNGPAR